MTRPTDDNFSQRNRFSRRNSGEFRERRRRSRRQIGLERLNSSRAYRQQSVSSQNIFERNFEDLHAQQTNTVDEERL